MQINPSIPTNAGGLPPNSSYTFSDAPTPPPQANTPVDATVTAQWVAFPQASGPVIGRAAAVVDEPIRFSGAPGSWTIVRMPPRLPGWSKSQVSATLDTNILIAKAPGLIVLEHAVCEYVRRIDVVAVRANMLDALQVSDASAARRRLISIVRDPGVTATSVVHALEETPFAGGLTFSRLLGNENASFNAKNFGA